MVTLISNDFLDGVTVTLAGLLLLIIFGVAVSWVKTRIRIARYDRRRRSIEDYEAERALLVETVRQAVDAALTEPDEDERPQDESTPE